MLITPTTISQEFIVSVFPDCLGSLAGLSMYQQIHDKILPNKIHADKVLMPANSKFVLPKKTTAKEIESLQDAVLALGEKRITNVDKNTIIQEYKNSCLWEHGLSGPVTSSKKGEPTNLPTNYPTIAQLVHDCTMKPSLDHQYMVDDPSLKNIIVILIMDVSSILSEKEILRIRYLNKLFNEVIVDVLRLRTLNFLALHEPRLGYATQESILQIRVDLATAGMIHYGLHPGMLIRYLKGEYTGKNRRIPGIIAKVSPYISKGDAIHIKQILTQGCPSNLQVSEPSAMKDEIIMLGNQQTFHMYPELVTKTMNKEEHNSHLIALKLWVLHCSPFCRSTAQGIQIKPGKNPRIISDSSTKTRALQWVLNEMTPIKNKSGIDFGMAKMKFLTSIYNWRISYPGMTIYIALADIMACFCFPRILDDITGAFGFVADELFFLATSHVFGSNTSASSWELLQRSIEFLIPVCMDDSSLIEKHAELLSMIKWDECNINAPKTQVHACKINQGVLDEDGNLLPPAGNIYVDDILSAGFSRNYILNLLAATIKAIFTVCGEPQTEVRQCPLSLEKLLDMIVGPVQIVLGLSVDTNKMMVGIAEEYREQVRAMLKTNWTSKRKFFQACDMQKLIGKIARLGEGAPWIFKLMSHLYVS